MRSVLRAAGARCRFGPERIGPGIEAHGANQPVGGEKQRIELGIVRIAHPLRKIVRRRTRKAERRLAASKFCGDQFAFALGADRQVAHDRRSCRMRRPKHQHAKRIRAGVHRAVAVGDGKS
jgi:hypothetical protein